MTCHPRCPWRHSRPPASKTRRAASPRARARRTLVQTRRAASPDRTPPLQQRSGSAARAAASPCMHSAPTSGRNPSGKVGRAHACEPIGAARLEATARARMHVHRRSHGLSTRRSRRCRALTAPACRARHGHPAAFFSGWISHSDFSRGADPDGSLCNFPARILRRARCTVQIAPSMRLNTVASCRASRSRCRPCCSGDDSPVNARLRAASAMQRTIYCPTRGR